MHVNEHGYGSVWQHFLHTSAQLMCVHATSECAMIRLHWRRVACSITVGITEAERAKLKSEIVEEVLSRISPQFPASVLFDAPWSTERLERIEQLERAVRQLQDSGVLPVAATDAEAKSRIHTSSDAEANMHGHASHGVAVPVPEACAAVAVEKPDSNAPGGRKRKPLSRLLRGVGFGRFKKAGKASKATQDGYEPQPSMWDATLLIGVEKIGTLPTIKGAILLMLNVIVQGQRRSYFVVVHSLVQHSVPLLLLPYR